MLKRAEYLLRFYLLTLLLFIAAKVLFMLCNATGNPFKAGDVVDVIYHGISLDLSTALYFLILPFLITIISIYWQKKPLFVLLRVYHLIIAIAFALAFVADTSLYAFWHFKLDASCLQYLETPTEAMASVSWGYIAIRLVIFVLVAWLIFKAYQKTVRTLRTASPPRADYKSALLGLLAFILSIPVFVIGIRGGLGESTTNVGQVYYSQNQFLNHSAVNPVFSFLASFEKTANNIVDYDYYSQEACNSLLEGVYPVTSVDTDTLLTMQRPDIVIILMESAGDFLADVMPRLQQLKKEGINFSNCYGNTWRTDRGTVCTYSGYPSFPTSSVMKMPSKTQHLPSIARTLQKAGYQTSYFYGGDINFTNMRSYLVGTGFEQLTWMKDFSKAEQETSEWGVRDDIMFKAVYQKLTSHHEKPQLIGFSTLSSHEPWDVPLQKIDEPIKNAFYYLDDCIGHFIDQLRQTPQWDSTLIVLLPDHSIDYGELNESKEARNRIPMVWTGGVVKAPRDVRQICNQTDLAATLLAQLGLPHDDFRWSRDVLSKTYQYPLAVHNFNNGFTMIDSTGFMVYDLNSKQIMVNRSSDAQRLEQLGKAVLQATTKDLKDMQ
jgi:phosphoglycerol transferase MdoB-like AlkP superfamily enzyme